MKNVKQLMKGFMATSATILGLGLLSQVYAGGGQTDVLQVSVTPNVTYGVTITSVNANGYQFGQVTLGQSTVSTSAIVVQNSGNIAEFFAMAISNSTGSWTATASAPGQDTFRLTGEFNATALSSATAFTVGAAPGGNSMVNALPGTASGLYRQGSTKTLPTSSQNLWLRLDMPTSLNAGNSGQQVMTLSINGQGN